MVRIYEYYEDCGNPSNSLGGYIQCSNFIDYIILKINRGIIDKRDIRRSDNVFSYWFKSVNNHQIIFTAIVVEIKERKNYVNYKSRS